MTQIVLGIRKMQIPQLKVLKDNQYIFLIVDDKFVFRIDPLNFDRKKIQLVEIPQDVEDGDYEIILTQTINDGERVVLLKIYDNFSYFYVKLYYMKSIPGDNDSFAEILSVLGDAEKILNRIPKLASRQEIIKKIFNIR